MPKTEDHRFWGYAFSTPKFYLIHCWPYLDTIPVLTQMEGNVGNEANKMFTIILLLNSGVIHNGSKQTNTIILKRKNFPAIMS